MPKASYVFAVVFQLFWTLLSFGSTPTDHLDSRLDRSVANYHVTSANFVGALVQAASEFKVPMGIQWVNTPESKANVDLSWRDSTVRQILTAITATQPGYEITLNNGVVHVSPTSMPPAQNFLLVKVESFELHQGVVELAERNLRTFIRTRMAPTPSESMGVGGSLATNVGEPRIDLQMNNVVAEDVLDALTTKSSRKIWVVTFVEDSKLTVMGFRRTLSLWSESPVPEVEQPVWNMFRWGETLPSAGLKVP